MLSGKSRKFTIFISIAGLSIITALAVAVIARIRHNYNLLVVFSAVVTFEALILAVYQTVFVDRIIYTKFISGDVEEFARLLILTSEIIEYQSNELAERHERVKELKKEMKKLDTVEIETWDIDDELDEEIERNFEEYTGKSVEDVIPWEK